jgi:hypothetical protein
MKLCILFLSNAWSAGNIVCGLCSKVEIPIQLWQHQVPLKMQFCIHVNFNLYQKWSHTYTCINKDLHVQYTEISGTWVKEHEDLQ